MKKIETYLALFLLALAFVILLITLYPYQPQFSQIIPVTPTPTPTPISWQIYRNDQYGFEFQYPGNLTINTDNKKIIISDPLEKYSKAIIDLWQFKNISYPASKWYKGKTPSLVCIDQNCPIEYKVSIVDLSNNLKSTLIEYNFGFSFEKNYLIYSPKTGYLSFHYGSNEDLVNQERKIIDTYNQILSTFKFLPDTSTWKTYKNTQYGFEFKYPSELNLILNPYDDKMPVFLVTDESSETVSPGGWSGVFISFSNQKNYKNLDDYINQEIMSEEVNSYQAKVQTSPRNDLDSVIVTGEVVGGNADSTPGIYIFKNGKIVRIRSNSLYYVELANQIFSTFKFISKTSISPTTTATKYICPASGWVDCQPNPYAGVKYECTPEALNWFQLNCPNFKGAAL